MKPPEPTIRIISLAVYGQEVAEVEGMIGSAALQWRAAGMEFWVRDVEYNRYPIGFYTIIQEICRREGIPRDSLRRAI
jgi:hypothetical protein